MYYSFSNCLRATRREFSLTQKQLAEKVGVVCQTIKNWERPRNLPNFEHMTKLDAIFHKPTLRALWNLQR